MKYREEKSLKLSSLDLYLIRLVFLVRSLVGSSRSFKNGLLSLEDKSSQMAFLSKKEKQLEKGQMAFLWTKKEKAVRKERTT